MVQSLWRKLTVEDVARELAADYRAAVERLAVLKTERGKAEYAFNRASTDVAVFGERIKERREQLGGMRRAAHDRGWWRDQDLANWERSLRGAEIGCERAGTHLKLAQDRLASAKLAADEALARIRPEAERVLEERRQVAENAREQLREIQEERQQEKQVRQLRL